MNSFTHLHVHTQYSLLDGAAEIKSLLARAKEFNMTALAITDHGNMFGVKEFHEYAAKYGIKPIIGCETYVASGSRFNKTDKEDRSGDHLILLAKNKTGYHNLQRLVSTSWIEGFYYKPRIDKELLRKYHDGLIACSACLGGEIPQAIMDGSIEKAETILEQYLEIFKDDFYLELHKHFSGNPARDNDVYTNQVKVNAALIEMSKKYGVKLIASNDVHFLNQKDAEAHDILVCLNTGKDLNDPQRMRYTGQEYFKSIEEMSKIFADIPEAISNTTEIEQKIEHYKLDRPVLLPAFPMPTEFTDQDEYLKHLSYEGAKKRFDVITDEIQERLDYELRVIKEMGFAGYFLITQDLIAAARDMGVSVGPGRGSAAGSEIAYCIGITNIDPIKYNLLFERFLNPERVSMPDIDIDFDEDGRESVLRWVVQKYGKDKVAQIITFGTMAAKMSIKDVSRVLSLPLSEANRLAKMVPEKPGTTLKSAFADIPELANERDKGEELIKKTLAFAETLEGSIRQTGTHACGIIIGPEDLIEHIPLSTSKDTDLFVTQYEGKYIESVGMLKMDFLGLKTLSIIKDAIKNIRRSKGIEIDIDKIPFDDVKTFELYQRGDTIGTFQFESQGMRMYLKDLKPTNIEDLIAMNALYRPGPMDFIPLYIRRKHGQEKVEYPHPMLEGLLKPTYGIMIYQEQIMQAAQIMANYSLGGADILRRAMGKKKADEMAKQKSIFIEGAKKNGVDEAKAAEVFGIMEGFASYGFNRSHSAAYSVVAFQTAYLKANYPAEYMAAVLSRNLSDIKKITTFMDECKRMGMGVYGPDVNESYGNFTVTKKGEIRFGLAGVKGVGENVVEEIIKEREKNGQFETIYDFVERVNLSVLNRRTIESLAYGGGFDCYKEIKRHQFFCPDKEGTFADTLIKYGSSFQGQVSSASTLFGGSTDYNVSKPEIPYAPEWSQMEMLSKEKELIGIYLSSHPLDSFRVAIKKVCNATLGDFENTKSMNGKEIRVAGIVTEVEHRTGKNGNPFGFLTLEDFTDSYRFVLFGKDYLNFKSYLTPNYMVMITGRNQPRFKDSTDIEFKISSITMLAEVQENMAKSIAIKVPVTTISDALIRELMSLSENNKGNAALCFLVYEPETKIWVQMASKTHKVNISDQLVNYLDSHSLEYKIA